MTDNDYLRKHYAHTDNKQLKVILCRGAEAICRQASKLKLSKAPKPSMAELILREASGPAGCRAGGKITIGLLRGLVAEKKLIKATLSYRHTRYFVNEADAKSMLAKFAPKPTKSYGVVMVKGRSRTSTEEWKNAEPYFDPKKPPKITIAPKPPKCWKTNTFGVMGG